MIEIENLTPEQVEMCDLMWSFESAEEYFEWYALLDDEDKRQADVLQCLIVLESMEPEIADMNNFWLARNYLRKFQLQ